MTGQLSRPTPPYYYVVADGGGLIPTRPDWLVERQATELRANPTPAHVMLGRILEHVGIAALSQAAVGPYVVDYLDPDNRTVIEVAPRYGLTEAEQRKAIYRDQRLREWGFTIYRFHSGRIRQMMSDLADPAIAGRVRIR
jgi:very-short-patch-repair endonuclease